MSTIVSSSDDGVLSTIRRAAAAASEYGNSISEQVTPKQVRAGIAILCVCGLLFATTVAWTPTQDADRDGASNLAEWTDDSPATWQTADTDNDGLRDGKELASSQFNATAADTDRDTVPDATEAELGSNPNRTDSDGDALADPTEHDIGTSLTDADTDGDGLTDSREYHAETKALQSDTDMDGLSDGAEIALGSVPTDADTDADHLSDGAEQRHNTSAVKADTDGDGLKDFPEVANLPSNPLREDTDSDGLTDPVELRSKTTVDDSDTDDDRLADGAEIANETSPVTADTDTDGLVDGREIKTVLTDPLHPDTDGDNLTDGREIHEHGTDPTLTDTDADRISDTREVQNYETDPAKYDTDSDTLSDGAELRTHGTDPIANDTDADSMYDAVEVNLSAYSATTAEPLQGTYEQYTLSEAQTSSLSKLLTQLATIANTAATDNPEAGPIGEYAQSIRSLPNISTTGTKVTLLDNAQDAAMYQLLDLLSDDFGLRISSSAFRARLKQGIAAGKQLSGLLRVLNDYARLQEQAYRLDDGTPGDDTAAKTALILATAILVVDLYLVIQTGGTFGLPSHQIAFTLTGRFAAKTGLARLAKFCSWKCVGGVERLIHWSLRFGLDTVESVGISQLVKVAYYLPSVSLDVVLKGIDIAHLLSRTAMHLSADIVAALEKRAQDRLFRIERPQGIHAARPTVVYR